MKILKALKFSSVFIVFVISFTMISRHVWITPVSVSMEYVNQSFRIYHHNDLMVYVATDEVYVRGVGYVCRKKSGLFR